MPTADRPANRHISGHKEWQAFRRTEPPTPHIAGNEGMVDLVAEMLADIGDHLLGKIVAGIEHGQHDALDVEFRLTVRRT